MDPYFSQNYAPEHQGYRMYNQQLFLQARDFIENPDADTELKFTVYWSNGQLNKLGNNGNWNKSLNIPPYDYVTEAELLGVSFPKIDNEMYFIIDIPEFHSTLHSSDNKGSHEKFCIVYYDNSTLNKGEIKPIKGTDFSTKKSIFKPPLQTLNKITIMFKKHNGDILTMDDITPGTDYQTMLNRISLLLNFKIKE